MLLEVLSDFQISIPELGVVEASTRPLVLLTSNNSRELTEALKRRCLYLWLDYPSVERELEIVHLHAPELDAGDRAQARRGRPHGARARPEEAALDRRVDRLGARAAAARRRGHRPGHAPEDDVDHRQAPHRPGPGGRARRASSSATASWAPSAPAERGHARACTEACRSPGPPGMAPRLLEFADELRNEGMAVGTSELLDAFQALDAVSWTSQDRLPRGARDHARQVAGGPPRARRAVRPLLLPRGRARGRPARPHRGALPGRRGARPRRAARAHPRGAARRQRRRDARPRPAGDRRVRAPGRGLRRDRRGRAADPAHARAEGRAARRRAARPGRRAARRAPGVRAARAPRARAPDDRAHAVAAARPSRCASSTAACRPTRPRTCRRCTAWSRR